MRWQHTSACLAYSHPPSLPPSTSLSLSLCAPLSFISLSLFHYSVFFSESRSFFLSCLSSRLISSLSLYSSLFHDMFSLFTLSLSLHIPPFPARSCVSLKAIEEVVAKHDEVKKVTLELTNNVAAARDDLARVKKDNNNIKDRVATAQAALNRAEVRGLGGGSWKAVMGGGGRGMGWRWKWRIIHVLRCCRGVFQPCPGTLAQE